ncbi:MAG: Coenzyme F420 hydrogenase/dehydrogenase, beta subunit C-terminal domain [Bacilli bacterium]|nr:Coenzyme F420 hydrogenase/dehydrogenase, beta subunit C-terminal domain [Bacilli bacterium]
MKNNVEKVEKCYGCSACFNICPTKCISMKPNKRGFLEPVIDYEKCINCGACIRICPRMKEYRKEVLKNPKTYILKNKSKEIRNISTSGGFFSSIADYFIENNGVIYGCIVDEDLKIKHIRTECDYSRMRGSKYVQSDLGNTFAEIKKDLLDNKLVLFTGSPCQCAGLKTYLGKDYDNLYIIDFICHGPQSPLIWSEYINFLTEKNGKIKDYHFRTKLNGWHSHTEVIEYESGIKEYDTLDSSLNKELFHLGLSLREACYHCQFTSLNRLGDITMGDAWGLEKIKPEFDDNLGTSLILINSEKGNKLFNQIKNTISYLEQDIEDYIVYNPRLKTSRPNSKKRDEFWKIYDKKGFKGIIKKYTGYSFFKKVKKIIKRILTKLHLWK